MSTRHHAIAFVASLVLYINAVHHSWTLVGLALVVVLSCSFSKLVLVLDKKGAVRLNDWRADRMNREQAIKTVAHTLWRERPERQAWLAVGYFMSLAETVVDDLLANCGDQGEKPQETTEGRCSTCGSPWTHAHTEYCYLGNIPEWQR